MEESHRIIIFPAQWTLFVTDLCNLLPASSDGKWRGMLDLSFHRQSRFHLFGSDELRDVAAVDGGGDKCYGRENGGRCRESRHCSQTSTLLPPRSPQLSHSPAAEREIFIKRLETRNKLL